MKKILFALLAMNVAMAAINFARGNIAGFLYGFHLVSSGFFLSAIIFAKEYRI